MSICGNIAFDERRTESKWVDGRRERFVMQIWDFVMVQGIFISGTEVVEIGVDVLIEGYMPFM